MAATVPSEPGGRLSIELLTFEHGRMIRPSASVSPSTLELSNSDHMNNFHHALTHFYEAPAAGLSRSSENAASVIERALEELLVHYPAAAGRLHVNEPQKRLEVQCNGDGVFFLVAHAGVPLSHLGNVASAHPSFDLLIPSLPSDQELIGPPLMAIQGAWQNGTVLSIRTFEELFASTLASLIHRDLWFKQPFPHLK
ncbi:hypothetical protein L7F22_036610 [Adiantum nelumboides]|nr:hypothetical protein [Adiantum nelumboides]